MGPSAIAGRSSNRLDWLPRRQARAIGLSPFRAAAAGPKTHGWARMCAITFAKLEPAGASAAVLAPIGFVCNHIEVLYDLDS